MLLIQVSEPPLAFYDAKKQSKRVENYFDCIKPVYVASRIFGFLPFTINHDSRGEVMKASISVFDAVWLIVSITANLTGIYYVLSHSLKQLFAIKESPILFDICRAIAVSGFVLTIISICLDMINRNRLIEIIKDFTKFDKQVKIV